MCFDCPIEDKSDRVSLNRTYTESRQSQQR